MTTTLTRTLGRFVWRELFTRDVEAAKRFYGGMFGWNFEDAPMGPAMTYTLIKQGDRQIAGIMNIENMPGDSSHVPAHWASYISVADVDQTVQKAIANGGRVISGCHDIPGIGRFAVLQDVTGAVFSLMHFLAGDPEDTPPGLHDFCWENLSTTDTTKSKLFYQHVIGWGTNPMGEATTVFTRIRNGEPLGLASMGQSPEGHSAWTPFVGVERIVEATAKAAELGGKVLVERTEIPTVGAFGVIEDPTGSVIFLFEGRAC
jgi:hypothetical protein